MFGRNAPRCPRCKDTVYAAEEVTGAGQKWHSQCFTCITCRTRLSSTTLADKDGEIYCQTCYAKQFGPKGFGIGSQSLTYTGVSVADSGKVTSPSASSYSAPKPAAASSPSAAGGARCCGKQATGKFCGECGKPVISTPSSSSAGSGSSPSYSSPSPSVSSAAKSWGNNSSSTSSSTSSIGIIRPPVMKIGGGDRCGKCNDRVYDAERVNGGGKVWHQACFRCETCRTGLNSQTLADKDGKIFCNACYSKNFGPKGYGFSGGAATTFGSTR